MDLKVRTTHIITTDDLEIYVGEQPLIFEAVSHISAALHNDLLAWARSGYPSDQSVDLTPRLFVSVSQNGQTYPLANREQAEVLRQVVGDNLLRDLIEEFWNYRYRFFKQKRLASENSGPRFSAGANRAG